MIRSAVLVSGKGTKLQSLLDSVFFGEIPELQLVAVISSDANAYALKRARNAGIETVVVEPAMFPNDTSYDMAIRNKLKDMEDRKSTRLNSSHTDSSRMPSSA